MDGYLSANMELSIFRGKDYNVKDGITIHQPTLGEIEEYGESDYFSLIHMITATPSDMKWQLHEIGIDYTTITDWELFYELLCQSFPKEKTSIIFGDLDISKFKPFHNEKKSDAIVLYDMDSNLLIDEYTYLIITDFLRKVHGLKRNEEIPGNESTKMILIEDAKEDYLINKNKEHHSYLRNLISAMVNTEGFKYNHDEVWSVKINAFMDSVKRINKTVNAKLLLQSGYSGFGIDLKKIDKKQLDWQGEL